MISRDAEGLKAAASAISTLQERVEESSSSFGLASAVVTAVAPTAAAMTSSPFTPGSTVAAAAALKSGPAPVSERTAMTAPMPSSDAASIAATMRIRLQLETASATVVAMLARKESCGSHYRSDAVQ